MHASNLSHALRLLAAVAAATCPSELLAGTTYTWDGSSGTMFTDASNWTPDRTTPAVDDNLVFSTPGFSNITQTPTQTVGTLRVTNGADLDFNSPTGTARVFTIAGDGTAAHDLVIDSGCQLELANGPGISMELSAAATGSVSGTFHLNGNVTNAAHRLTAFNQGPGVEGLTFNSTGRFANNPNDPPLYNPFGTNVDSVRFKDGSIYYHGGTSSGSGGEEPKDPFGVAAPSSVVWFDSDSTFYQWSRSWTTTGRTYGNIVVRNGSGSAMFTTGGSWNCTDFHVAFSIYSYSMEGGQDPVITVNGDFTVASNANFTVSNEAGSVEVKGDIEFSGTGTGGNLATGTNRLFKLTGATTQSITMPAGENLPDVKIDNPNGVRLLSDVNLIGTLDLAQGVADTNGFTLSVPDGLAALTRTDGFVSGTLSRSINAATTGERIFPVGTEGEYSPVTVDITSPGVGSGSIAVTAYAADQPDVAGPDGCLDRFWTVAGTGLDLSGGSATLGFSYQESDVTGTLNEAGMVAASRSGGAWNPFPGTVVNAGLNTALVSGVTHFSDWTLGNPAALPVNVSSFHVE